MKFFKSASFQSLNREFEDAENKDNTSVEKKSRLDTMVTRLYPNELSKANNALSIRNKK